MGNILRAAATLSLVGMLVAVSGFSQTFGEVTGRVTDSSGAAAPV